MWNSFSWHKNSPNLNSMKQLIKIAFFIYFSLPGTLAFSQVKIAHVDTQKLLDTLPSRKTAVLEIQELKKRGLDELTEMDQQLEKAYNDYLGRRDQQTPQINQYDENRLQKMQEAAQKREQELNELIQQMNVVMNEKTLKLVKDAIANVAAKKGMTYVLDLSSTLYANGTNITNDVIVELLRLDALAKQ